MDSKFHVTILIRITQVSLLTSGQELKRRRARNLSSLPSLLPTRSSQRNHPIHPNLPNASHRVKKEKRKQTLPPASYCLLSYPFTPPLQHTPMKRGSPPTPPPPPPLYTLQLLVPMSTSRRPLPPGSKRSPRRSCWCVSGW